MKKALAFLTASVMALGSLPFLSVGAEDAFAPGDVDMDGVLTGHDAALVSRHLIHGDNNLSEEQLKLADYNGDGVVDEEDAKAIVADEEYPLGDLNKNGFLDMDDVFETMCYYKYSVVGNFEETAKYSQTQLNQMDFQGMQAKPSLNEISNGLLVYVNYSCGLLSSFWDKNGNGVYALDGDQKCYYIPAGFRVDRSSEDQFFAF